MPTAHAIKEYRAKRIPSRYRDKQFAETCADLLKRKYTIKQIAVITSASAPTVRRALEFRYPELVKTGSKYKPTVGRPRGSRRMLLAPTEYSIDKDSPSLPNDPKITVYQIVPGREQYVPLCTGLGFGNIDEVLAWAARRGLDFEDMVRAHSMMVLHAETQPQAPPLLIEDVICAHEAYVPEDDWS